MDTSTTDTATRDLPIAEVRYFTSIDSTNEEAKRWLKNGASNFCLVFADEQTEGRGRLGRKWITKKGSAIAVSLIITNRQSRIKPSLKEIVDAGMLLRLTALGTLAIQSALKEKCQLSARIKWPNDVLIDGKKVAGVLVETIWSGEDVIGTIIGMGINVKDAAIPDARYLNYPATSLESELGKSIERTTILQQILDNLFAIYPLILDDRFLNKWENELSSLHQKVKVMSKNDQNKDVMLTATVIGLANNGELIVQTKEGKQIFLQHGDFCIT